MQVQRTISVPSFCSHILRATEIKKSEPCVAIVLKIENELPLIPGKTVIKIKHLLPEIDGLHIVDAYVKDNKRDGKWIVVVKIPVSDGDTKPRRTVIQSPELTSKKSKIVTRFKSQRFPKEPRSSFCF